MGQIALRPTTPRQMGPYPPPFSWEIHIFPKKSSIREARVVPYHLLLILDWDGKRTDCEIFLFILILESLL